MLVWWLLLRRLKMDSARARYIFFILSATGACLTFAVFLAQGSNQAVMVPAAVLASLALLMTLPSLVRGFELDMNVYRSLGAPGGLVTISFILEIILFGVFGAVVGVFLAGSSLIAYATATGTQSFAASVSSLQIGLLVTLATILPGAVLISNAILKAARADSPGFYQYDH